jgi:hypothetical protein
MFSLRTLFLVVAMAALAAGSLVAHTFWLISAFVALTLGIVCWAFLLRAESMWRGLCLFGSVYLLCAVLPVFRTVSDMLPSTRLSEVLIERNGPIDNPFADDALPADCQGDPLGQLVQQPPPNPFRDALFWEGKRLVLHCIAALLFGTAGGLLFQWSAQQKKAGT